MANNKELLVEVKTKWEVPEVNDARILTMPNIPHALQGEGYQPRTLVRSSAWNFMRKKCYERANYKCEVCGDTPAKGKLHAHELYDTNYVTGEHKFKRLVALCYTCHVLFIHSGRALTLYKQGSPLARRDSLLYGVEHGFKQIHEYNKAHPDEKINAFAAFLDYLNTPDLTKDMEKLIDKYDIKFWGIPKAKTQCEWKDWHLVFNNKKYYTKYKDIDDYQDKMQKKNKRENANWNLTGGIFNEIDKIISEGVDKE